MVQTFFSIVPPEGRNAREWADQYWDTYGFDFDIEKSGPNVFAWSIADLTSNNEGPAKMLADALSEDGISFTTFTADDNAVFGLTNEE